MVNQWQKKLEQHLVKKIGGQKSELLIKKYKNCFPLSYCEQHAIPDAIEDILHLERLSEENTLELRLYYLHHELHLKLFQFGNAIPLSDILPLMENMGLRTVRERPYEIIFSQNNKAWISDFLITLPQPEPLKITAVASVFIDAFKSIYAGRCENDGMNRLVLAAGLHWEEIIILRTYSRYLQQIGFRFSQNYIEKTIEKNALLARYLIEYFCIKFSPSERHKVEKKLSLRSKKIKESLDLIASLDEDSIMRSFWQLIDASLRTNYFQKENTGSIKPYLSIKLRSAEVPNLSGTIPLYETFVYSPRFQGIHLRSAKVARGGLRWSEREDFRTEILGLMKAQKVKNSVIVPSGAKGGFVLKTPAYALERSLLQQEVIACYQFFIRGLLDITDNLQKNQCIKPSDCVCYDDDDPYLVVAADKGTASFSDIANSIAKEYNFWLGDAFASGGKTGYDHKKMGITARGTWESIKRHFREFDIDITNQDFTVVGIGDMSGDVFGNGMLYTPHIRLIAAFDHRHIFIDPNPDAEIAFHERARLFALDNSSWADYDPKLISAGGGVYARSEKAIHLSISARKALAIDKESLTPQELIVAILQAPVDLLFNGGIGTYVKATFECNAEVGDKTNEFCRVNGNELRCKVVGEGGNLGCTQLGRIEYALQGGLINTDFIDNSAGVDCSDHEVNIKILLDNEIKLGNLNEKKRNQLLLKMTNEVADLVLQDNYYQALVMSVSRENATRYLGLYQAYMNELEACGLLNRAQEYLPDDKKLLERKAAGKGLTRPELAVLLAYTKIYITQELLKSSLPDDPHFDEWLATAFPPVLAQTYSAGMKKHRLRREIIATQLSNQLVNMTGITFMYRMMVETGASVAEIARAYSIAASIYETDKLFYLIDSLNFKIPLQTQYDFLHHIRHLLNLSTRWFLRDKRSESDLGKVIAHYRRAMVKIEHLIPELMLGFTREYMDEMCQQFIAAGLTPETARKITMTRALYTTLNVVDIASKYHVDLQKTARVYFMIGGKFNLVWFRDQIANDLREGHWNTMARLSLRNELDTLQRRLATLILQSNRKENDARRLIITWTKHNTAIKQRWDKLLELLHGSDNIDYTIFFIALRELSDLIHKEMD